MESDLARGLLDEAAARRGGNALTQEEEAKRQNLATQRAALAPRILARAILKEMTEAQRKDLGALVATRSRLEADLTGLAARASRREIAAVLHTRVGRQVGSRNSTTDVLSPLTQRKRGFKVESLPTSSVIAHERLSSTPDRLRHDEFEEWLRDNTRSPVPDQAAFRVDFPTFLASLGRRDRTLARFLALGHPSHVAATRFGMSAGRVSQLRRAWRERWRQAQGEEMDSRPRDRNGVSA
jgi:hypothetical protein